MKHLLLLLSLFAVLPLMAQQTPNMPNKHTDASCPVIKIEAERLPDLNIPRYGYNLFCLNGEPTVIGGHTSGFVLTPTAEYFKDGKWHLLPTVYTHDGGFGIAMKSGQVLLAGGFKDNLGIGQSFEVEKYNPVTHHFEGFGCLDRKRASAAAVELDSGRVLITGNWYADDAMEIYDGRVSFSHVKHVSQSRYLPHIFKISKNDALIVAAYDHHGEPHDTILIDRLQGEPFKNSIFDTWHPLLYDLSVQSDDSFIGDESQGIYAYLMPVKNQDGQIAIIEVRDTAFSFLPTTCPVPMQSQWGEIIYYTPIYTDRQRQRGYILGCDSTGRQYVLCIEYAINPAKLTLYHTDELTDTTALSIPVVTDEGNLLLTGLKSFKPNSNFAPSASVWLLRFNDDSKIASANNPSLWIWGALLLIMVIIMLSLIWLKKKKSVIPHKVDKSSNHPFVPQGDELLMQRIRQLMEEQKPYLNSDLKVSDLADRLSINSRNLSDCIRKTTNDSFANFINAYRIEYAKQLMREQPDMKLSEVFLSSGFANETTFFRIFKAVTGMTPNEWKASR
jgi:AraC-like DNA-binding protein